MNQPRKTIYLKGLFILTLTISTLIACNSIKVSVDKSELNETILVQSTWIANLSTQVAQQEKTNVSQWEAISYLSTQMPFARGLITPIPPGITITPTAYSLSEQEQDSPFTPTPSPSIDIEYPPGTRSGIEEIDKVINAIQDEDIDARLELVRLITTACTTTDGLGGPPKCQPDERDSTLIDAFPVSYGEGTHIRQEDIKDVFGFTVRGLFAVYRVPGDAYETDYWPAGEYGIVFTSEEGGYPHVITVLVEDGQIVRLDLTPGWPPFDLVWEKSDEFILPPIR
jgi:hypothetical protein